MRAVLAIAAVPFVLVGLRYYYNNRCCGGGVVERFEPVPAAPPQRAAAAATDPHRADPLQTELDKAVNTSVPAAAAADEQPSAVAWSYGEMKRVAKAVIDKVNAKSDTVRLHFVELLRAEKRRVASKDHDHYSIGVSVTDLVNNFTRELVVECVQTPRGMYVSKLEFAASAPDTSSIGRTVGVDKEEAFAAFEPTV